MKLAQRSVHTARWLGGALLAAGLGMAGAAFAAEDMSNMQGHDMSNMQGHDMSNMHAHHHAVDANAAVKISAIDVKLTAVPMVRQDGLATTLTQELAGNKPTILAFIYTSCTTICPVTSQILSGVQDHLGGDLAGARIVSVSIDPEYDTPERLLAYSKRFEAKPQWQHYGGTLASSVAIQKMFGAYRGDKMNHVSLIFVNGGGKQSWVQIEGFPTAEQVVKELRGQIKG